MLGRTTREDRGRGLCGNGELPRFRIRGTGATRQSRPFPVAAKRSAVVIPRHRCRLLTDIVSEVDGDTVVGLVLWVSL